MEFESIKQNKEKKNLVLTLTILSLIAISMLLYILSETYDNNCETEKNESYALGFNQGTEYWNNLVSYTYNNRKVLSYFYNQSYYELNLSRELCGE